MVFIMLILYIVMLHFIGNAPSVQYFHKLLDKLSGGGFIVLCGPQYIGKMTLIHSVLNQIIQPMHQLQDLIMIQDFSDQWLELKASNDKLIWSTHTFKIESDPHKVHIKLPDGSIYKDLGAREVSDRLNKSPAWHKKLLVIENIERMTIGASNALLKTLEEPLQDRLIIWTSSNPQLLLPTIASRATSVNFYPVPDSDIKDGLIAKNGEWWVVNSELFLGRPGLAIKMLTEPKYQELFRTAQLIHRDYLIHTPLGDKHSVFMTAHEQGLLQLLLDILQVTLSTDRIRSAKLLQTKKYLQSNVWVGNIIMDMLI